MAIHFISEPNDRDQPKNSWFDKARKTFCSGYWDISAETAGTIIGGWLYIHASKATPSYYGGRVSGFRVEPKEELKHQNRVVFDFMPSSNGKGHFWRGQEHGNAWTGRNIPADLPHELEASNI